MSYNSSIPQVNDFIAISQKQMLANYQAIGNSFAINHIPLGKANQGMHNSLTFRPQGGDPTTVGFQGALYSKLVTGTPQLFYRANNNGNVIQLTNSNYSRSQSATTFQISTFSAGPFTIYIGFLDNVANGSNVALTPSTTLRYVGLTTILRGTFRPSLVNVAFATNITGNQFTVSYETALTPNPAIYYLAIGQ